MATNFTQDGGFVNVATGCSDNIKRFINGLNLAKDPIGEIKDFPIDYNFLTRLGCLQTDGDGKYFRILDFYNDKIKQIQHGGLRTYDEQQKLFEIGRKINVKENIPVSLVAPEGLRGSAVVFTDVSKIGDVVTNLAGGASYHNYGLAVDFVLRHFGETVDKSRATYVDGILYDNLYKIYDRCGLLKWAKICHLEWGGLWADFPDFAHWQDTDYKPLPYVIYGKRCLQNSSNCNFETVAKYWSGKFKKSFEDYARQVKISLGNIINGSTSASESVWQTWTTGRGSTTPLSADSAKGSGGVVGAIGGAVGVAVLAVIGLIFATRKRGRR